VPIDPALEHEFDLCRAWLEKIAEHTARTRDTVENPARVQGGPSDEQQTARLERATKALSERFESAFARGPRPPVEALLNSTSTVTLSGAVSLGADQEPSTATRPPSSSSAAMDSGRDYQTPRPSGDSRERAALGSAFHGVADSTPSAPARVNVGETQLQTQSGVMRATAGDNAKEDTGPVGPLVDIGVQILDFLTKTFGSAAGGALLPQSARSW
jgi:hypothetical protein